MSRKPKSTARIRPENTREILKISVDRYYSDLSGANFRHMHTSRTLEQSRCFKLNRFRKVRIVSSGKHPEYSDDNRANGESYLKSNGSHPSPSHPYNNRFYSNLT